MKKFSCASKLSVVLTVALSNILVIGGIATQPTAAATVASVTTTNEPVACEATGEIGHISGTVSDTSSGTKVAYTAGAQVRLLDTDSGIVLACVIADASGHYAIDTERRGSGATIVVDPIDGSSRSLGSSGGPVRITSTPVVRDYSLGIAKWAGNVRMNTVDGELSPTGTYVCLKLMAQTILSKCGFVLPRSSADGLRWAIADSGIEDAQYIESSYGSGSTRTVAFRDLVGATDLLSIELVSNFQGGGPPSIECAVGEEPNIKGQVTIDGAGYATRVTLGASWYPYSSTIEPFTSFWYGFTNSAADGTFGFCSDFADDVAQMPAVLQVQAGIADFARDVSLGATNSPWVSSACLLSAAGCDLGSFAMAEKVLWGRVTADLDRNTSTPGSALAGARISINPTTWDDDGNGWSTSFETDPNGQWAFAQAPSGSFELRAESGNSCQPQVCTIETDEYINLVPKTATLVRTGNIQEFNIEISPGNFGIRMFDPEWLPLSSRTGFNATAYVDSTFCNDPNNQDTQMWWTGCRVELSNKWYSNGVSLYQASLPQGKYVIVGQATDYANSFAKVSVNANLEVSIDEGTMRLSESGIFELAASNGNLRFKLTRPDTNSRVTGVSYRVGSSLTSFITDGALRADANGDLIWNVTKEGVYEVIYSYLQGNASNAGVAAKSFHFKIALSDSGEASIVNQCTSTGGSTVCAESPPPMVDGQYQLTMELANLKFSVCPLPANESCGSGLREWSAELRKVTGVERWLEAPESNGFFWGKLEKAISTSSTALDIYELQIQVPWGDNNLWVPIIKYISIDNAGVIKSCSTQECTSSSSVSFDASSGTYDLGELRYSTGNVVGRVLKPGTSTETVAGSRGRAQRIGGVGTNYASFRTNSDGKFSLKLLPGTYALSAEPSSDGNSSSSNVYTSGSSTIVVGSDGLLVGNADVRLTEPNLQGFVRAGVTTIAYSWVQVYKWNTINSSWEWRPGVSTRTSGAYAVNLAEGKWRLTASPSNTPFARDFADGELIVVVNAAGEVFSESGDQISGSVDISFKQPNIKFVLTTPGIGYAGLNIFRFDTVRNYFQWQLSYSISSSSGGAANLQTGRYKVLVDPYNNSAFVQTEKFIKVGSDGQICILTNETSTECATGSFLAAPAQLSIGLNGPNLRGTVTLGEGGAGTTSWIQIEKYNSTTRNFQWVNGASSNSLGQFATRLQPGWYRLTANPYGSGGGFSRTVTYVVVYESDSDGDTWCRPAAATSPAPCADTNGALYGADDNFGIALEPSNIRATVRYNNSSVSDGWVSVSKKVNDNFQWFEASAQIVRGELGMVLPGGTQPIQYRLTVNPPYLNTYKLGKKRVTLWVGDFVTGGRTDDVCLQTELSTGQTCLTANVRTSGAEFAIEMATANVVGEVLNPLLTSTKVPGSGVEVRVWSNNSWQWTDNYVSSDSNGAISVNLDPGTYQLTARVPWNSSDTLTNSDPLQITVQEDGSWCLDPNPTSSVCNQADVLSLLSIPLGVPNLVATLKYGTTLVPNAWINVFVEETNTWGTWWRYLDKSSSSNQSGKIAVDLSVDGKYRIEVQPPYSSPDGVQMVKFSTYFRIKDEKICRGECDDTSTYVPSLADEVLNFPVPNLLGTVKDSGGTTLQFAWIHVEKWVPSSSDGYWKWTDNYAHSNFGGKFALLLDAGKYRVRVNPPWNNSTLPRFTKIVNVDADGKVCIDEGCTPSSTSLSADFVFPLPNITGKVKLKSGVNPVLSKWSWIGASRGSQYDWSNTNVDGDFGMYLEDGNDWSLWFYPDYSKSNVQPMNVKATISNGLLTSWRYSFEPEGTNRCVSGSSSPCLMDVAFDYELPNFKTLVSFETAPVAGAFVRLTQVVDSPKVFDFVTNDEGLVTGNIPLGQYTVSVVDAKGEQTRTGSGSISVASTTALLSAADVTVSVQG
jgi:hypothetical protein